MRNYFKIFLMTYICINIIIKLLLAILFSLEQNYNSKIYNISYLEKHYR